MKATFGVPFYKVHRCWQHCTILMCMVCRPLLSLYLSKLLTSDGKCNGSFSCLHMQLNVRQCGLLSGHNANPINVIMGSLFIRDWAGWDNNFSRLIYFPSSWCYQGTFLTKLAWCQTANKVVYTVLLHLEKLWTSRSPWDCKCYSTFFIASNYRVASQLMASRVVLITIEVVS
jgi:hypothetical protein